MNTFGHSRSTEQQTCIIAALDFCSFIVMPVWRQHCLCACLIVTHLTSATAQYDGLLRQMCVVPQ